MLSLGWDYLPLVYKEEKTGGEKLSVDLQSIGLSGKTSSLRLYIAER